MAISEYERQTQNWSVTDTMTAARMQEINTDLSSLFARLDGRGLTYNYTALGLLIQFVDTINLITVDIDWVDFDAPIPKLYIQESGDPKRFTITYNGLGFPISCIYA